MCKILEEMKNEAALDNARETALRMIKGGKLSLETIAEYANLPLEEVKALADPVMV